MPETPDREFLLGIFLMEAWDSLATLEDGVGRLRGAEPGAGAVEPLLVVSHRLKGASALQGFPGLSGVAGALEQLLERAPGLPAAERAAAAEFLGDVVGLLKKVLDGVGGTGQENGEEIEAFRARHPAFFPSAPAETAPTPGPASSAAVAPPTNGALRGLRQGLDRFFAENADILTYFRPEAAEHLETMTQALLALEQTGRSEEELGRLFRAVHTLKGAAYTVGCTAVGDLAHQVEDLLVAVREERMALTPAAIEAVLAGTDALRLLLGLAEAAPDELEPLVEGAMTQLGRLVPGPPAGPGVTPVPPAPAGLTAITPPSAPGTRAEPDTPARKTPAPAPAGIRVSLDRLDSLMNLVGELVIARSRLDRRLRELDRVGELLLFSRSRMAKAVKDFESKRAAGAWTPPPAEVSGERGQAGGREPREPLTRLFAELEFDRYDDFDILGRSVAELSADLAEVQTQVGGLIRTIWEDTAQIQRLTGSLRNEITRARMVPVGRLFARFPRQVREAARAAGKTVALAVSGESVEVDNTIIEQIADPLLHLIQNAIAHGIEPEDERRARGKPPHGTIYLAAAHRGGSVSIEVEDDGRGVDVVHLRAEAVRQGFLRSEEAATLSPRETLNLMFLPGFTTASAVTTASGRGVGLDVVRTNVSRLNGEIDVETEDGVGTRFTLKLPLTVMISDALMVRAGSETLAIPLNAVQLILAVAPAAIQSVGRAQMVRVDDQLVDLFRMDRLLGLAGPESRDRVPVVVLRAGGTSMAVAVDELLGKEEIVIKSLGGFRQGIGPFTGATISGEGRVILLVDPVRLLQLAEGPARVGTAAHPARGEEAESERARPPAEAGRRVLLVDDSISVRKFVGHMLERAGFRVVTANDGAEALQQLTETAVHLVITDLEMPRVNGYELIEDLRRRPATRDLPVVVLTTRAGEKHLGLARRLGVKHYVSKPVDEQAFVRLVASLTAGQRVEPELAGAVR
ncbi:MAG: Hpt domain-containing protein [Candidatus Rokubacteria bacterium]|nr:Hpt domain-containing protein [Candidatus Rokubacteria bacterium]